LLASLGAYERGVKYVSVIGNSIKGKLALSSLESLLAYSSYSVLSGQGEAEGDGIIPVPAAALDGAQSILIEVTIAISALIHRNCNDGIPIGNQAFELSALTWEQREAVGPMVRFPSCHGELAVGDHQGYPINN
jgi:hypothetical protein